MSLPKSLQLFLTLSSLMDVYINGKKVRADPKRAIGKGGEADVFNIGQKTALKLFKQPDHPDYQGLPQEQQAARDRLHVHQQKLRQFPPGLPAQVIAPDHLATDKTGQTILGYTMPLLQNATVLLKYSDRGFRQAGIPHQRMIEIFQDLHETIAKLHTTGIVIGDFNDLNVLIQDTKAYLIDADSFQFSSFLCSVFTARFVDPLLCDASSNQLMLNQAHNANSDWYAFAVMLMQCLLFVDPYGGVYKPKSATHYLPHAARPLHRITIFHPAVRYPKPAIPYQVLSDDLLHYFHQVFEQDLRGEFPRSLLDRLHWQTCPHCGTDHARPQCPQCTTQMVVTPPPQQTSVRGTVTATPIFHAPGTILAATVEQGRLQWLYHDGQQVCREDGSVILQGDLQPHLRWRIQGKTTLLGYQGQGVKFQPDRPPEKFAVDSLGAIAQFDVNPTACYWLCNGQLLRQDWQSRLPSSVYIGDCLVGQTRFWVGATFGLGFYQAGHLNVAFVFDAHKLGINDRVKLPPWHGQLIDASCHFSQDYGWLFLTTQTQGQIHHHCIVIHATGTVMASEAAISGQDHWLAKLFTTGAAAIATPCAVNHFLWVATDDGIVRIDCQTGQLQPTKTFPDTEPFVNSQCQLFAAIDGLYVVNHQIIQFLRLN